MLRGVTSTRSPTLHAVARSALAARSISASACAKVSSPASREQPRLVAGIVDRGTYRARESSGARVTRARRGRRAGAAAALRYAASTSACARSASSTSGLGARPSRNAVRERVVREVLVHEHLPVGIEAVGRERLPPQRVDVVALRVLLVGAVHEERVFGRADEEVGRELHRRRARRTPRAGAPRGAARR